MLKICDGHQYYSMRYKHFLLTAEALLIPLLQETGEDLNSRVIIHIGRDQMLKGVSCLFFESNTDVSLLRRVIFFLNNHVQYFTECSTETDGVHEIHNVTLE